MRRSKEKEKIIVVMAEGDDRMLQDYALPKASGITSSIVRPTIEANNFPAQPGTH